MGIGNDPALFFSLSREKGQWNTPRRIPLTLGAQVRLIASLFGCTKQAKSEPQQDIGEEKWDAEAPL